MKLLTYLPRPLRIYLRDQPLPDSWKQVLAQSLTLNEEEIIQEKLDLEWKPSHKRMMALIVMVLSAIVVYNILN